MFASQFVLGLSLVCLAIWLHWTERKGWPNESYDSELDAAYLNGRMRSRRRVNVIIGFCGALIMLASSAGPQLFVLAWTLVTMALLLVVILAAVDVVRTQRYHGKKLPEIRRRTLHGDD